MDLALRDSGAWTIRFAQALTVQGPQDPQCAAGCYDLRITTPEWRPCYEENSRLGQSNDKAYMVYLLYI